MRRLCALLLLSAVLLIVKAADASPVSTPHRKLTARHLLQNSTFNGITEVDYLAMYDTYVPAGFIPTQLRGYYDEGGKKVLYDVTFSPNPPGRAFVAKQYMNSAEYQQENDKLTAEGYTLRVHSPFDVQGALYHAAVWTKP